MKNLITLICVVGCIHIVTSQTIEKFSINSGGTSASAGGIEILYTIGEVAVAERSASGVSLSEGFINPEFRLQINAQALLQGPILNPDTSGLMDDDLRAGGFIPTTSPYVDGATCEATVFNTTGNNAIVDWVWLSIRMNDDNQRQIQGRSALLQRDGDIVDVDGTSDVTLTIPQNTYYIAIEHRNHLSVMSANPVQFDDASAVTVDFKDASFSTFGSNAQAVLGSGDRALWAGDVNGNGQVRYLGPGNDTNVIKDAVLLLSSSNFFPYTDYDNADINLNGQVRYLGPGNDTNILKDIILSHPSNGGLSNFFPFTTSVPPVSN